MEAKAKTAKTDMRIEYEMQLEALRKHREEAMAKLQEVQASSGEAWKDIRTGADAAWASMREALEKSDLALPEVMPRGLESSPQIRIGLMASIEPAR